MLAITFPREHQGRPVFIGADPKNKLGIPCCDPDCQPEQSSRRKKLLSVHALLDASGSMYNRRTDTIGGFNAFLDDLRKNDETDVEVSLATFNDEYHPVFEERRLTRVKALTNFDYQPKGGTALLDAVGKLISRIEDDPSTAHLVLVITDGEENSSSLYSRNEVRQFLTNREKRGNWTFVYFGADPSTWAEASRTGFSFSNTGKWDTSNVKASYGLIGVQTNALRSQIANTGSLSTSSYFDNNATLSAKPDLRLVKSA